MKLNNKNKCMLVIISIIFITTIISIISKKNIFVIAEIATVLAFIGIYIYIDEVRLLYALIIFVLLSNYISKYISVISYLPYIIIFIMFIKILENKFILKKKIKGDKFIIRVTLLIFTINILSLMYNQYESNIALLMFYSLKKFGYIILYIYFMNLDIDRNEILKLFRIFIYFALVQIPFIIIQFLQGVTQDNITGLFGNNSTGILLQYLLYILIIVGIYKKKIIKNENFDIIFMILCIIYSAIAEVKLGFIVVPLIYILMLLFERRFIKLFAGVAVLLISFNLIYGLFTTIYPEHDFLGNSNFTKQYIKNAYGINSVNRTGFMDLLQNTVLDSREKVMFGTGLASINPSSLQILEGKLLKQYSYLNLHYFTLPYLVTENGIIGTCLWISIYIYILMINLYFYIKNRDHNSIIIIMSIIITFIFIYYNSSIITSPIITMMIWLIIAFFNNKKINLKYK